MSKTATTTVAVNDAVQNRTEQQQDDGSAVNPAAKRKITLKKSADSPKEAPKDRSDGSNNTRKLQAKAKMKKASEFVVKDGQKKPTAKKKAAASKKDGKDEKATAKKKDKTEAKKKEGNGGPTQKELKVLELVKDKALTRKELSFKTGVHKGWSACLGAPNKGEAKPDTMQGKGWITQEGSPLEISITKDGKAVLTAYKKAEATAAKN